MCTVLDFLTTREIELVIQYLDEIILDTKQSNNDDLKTEAIAALVDISKIKADAVMSITFPAFMAKLPDSDRESPGSYLLSLEALVRLSVEEHIFELFLRRLLNKLDVVLLTDSTPAYPLAILLALFHGLRQKDLTKDSNLEMYFERLVVGLVRRAVQPVKESTSPTALNEELLLHAVGKVANVIVRTSPNLLVENPLAVADDVYTLFTPGFSSLEALAMTGERSPEHRRLIILSTYMLASIRPTLSPKLEAIPLFERLVTLAISETDSATRTALLVQIALVGNKWLASEKGSQIVRQTLQRLTRGLHEVSDAATHSQPLAHNSGDACLRILLWLTKGLLLRLDSSVTHFLDLLLALLADPRYGLPTARGFSLLLAPHDLVTDASNFVTIRRLYKQRLLDHCLPRLAADFRAAASSSSSSAGKSTYLIALAGILQFAPTPIVMLHVETLLPLLLQTIDLPLADHASRSAGTADVKAASIDTLAIMVREAPAAVEGHISSLLARLLQACECADAVSSPRTLPPPPPPPPNPVRTPVRVRSAALACLRLFPSFFRHERLRPHRTRVLKALVRALDDPKRDVRKEAVDCRAAWLRMDEVDG
ncbi:MAG: hypothetical protein M1826_003567 [Phylliscum demangeonii]|nr:MAG: hypothetical protein M1826_003567 [Phylliscum demangeonii]